MSVPSQAMRPRLCLISPAMARRVLLLPAPLAPIRVTMAPWGTSRDTPFKAWMPP